MVKPRDSEAHILKVAMLYYEGGFTQEQIAKKFGVSRPTVVRLLQQARDRGFVEIRITKECSENTYLETALEGCFDKLGLREVVVVDTDGLPGKTGVAKASANYMARVLKTKDVLGIGWSTTLMELPNYINNLKVSPERVVQLGGGLSYPGAGSAQEIIFRLGRSLSSQAEPVNAPVIVKNKEVRDALLEDAGIASANGWADKCTIAFVGVGTADNSSTLVQCACLKAEEVEGMSKLGAVGDILAHYYDVDGKPLPMPWCDRLISRSFEQLKAVDNLVVLASGAEKASAVLGALRAGIVNTLVIDLPLAKAIKKLK